MRDPLFERVVPLRIDVDFRSGLLLAVPAMLDVLERYGMQASFFVVAGSNPPSRSLARLRKRDYRRRVVRLGLWRSLTVLSGGDSPMLTTPSTWDVVRRIEAEGHELVVHGWDHAWWAENVWSATTGRLEQQIDLAYDAVERAAGPARRAWGSPNWRSRDDVMALLAARGAPYFSECWGHSPFSSHDRVHLPVTDNLEERVLERGPSPACVDEMLDARDVGAYRLICAHDYFEGLLHPALFEALIEGCRRRGLRTVALQTVAARLDPAGLEPYTLERGSAAGFCGEVSRQSRQPAGVLTSALP